MQKNTRIFALIAACLFCVAATKVFAQGGGRGVAEGDWVAVQNAARKEGKVVLFTNTLPALNDRIARDFKDAYPDITLELTRINGALIVARLDQERQSGTDSADVVLTYELLWLGEEAKKGRFSVPTGPANLVWPAVHRLAPSVPIMSVEPFVLVYNTDLVKEDITSYRDLLNPAYKGKIGIADLAATAVVAWYDWLEKSQGSAYLQALAAQAPRLYPGTQPSTQAAAAGEINISHSLLVVANPLIQNGAKLKIVIPKPAFGTAYAGAILAGSSRPSAGQVFFNYLMSPRGQALLNGSGASASPLPNIPGSLNIDSIVAFEPAKYPPEIVKPYSEKWNRIFKP